MRKNIIKFFNEIAQENNINIKDELSWGFYFSDDESELLREAKRVLDKEGYSTLEIFYENKTYYLCVEEICVHSSNSLYERCEKFEKLAKELNIHSFDGFDVEEQGLK